MDFNATNKARCDLPKLIKSRDVVESYIQKIMDATDEKSAHKLAFRLYLDVPFISGLHYYTSLSLSDRTNLVKRVNFDDNIVRQLNELALYLHHNKVSKAFCNINSTFQLPADFNNDSFIITEMCENFMDDELSQFIDSLYPWVGIAEFKELITYNSEWFGFVEFMTNCSYTVYSFVGKWFCCVKQCGYKQVIEKSRMLLETVLRCQMWEDFRFNHDVITSKKSTPYLYKIIDENIHSDVWNQSIFSKSKLPIVLILSYFIPDVDKGFIYDLLSESKARSFIIFTMFPLDEKGKLKLYELGKKIESGYYVKHLNNECIVEMLRKVTLCHFIYNETIQRTITQVTPLVILRNLYKQKICEKTVKLNFIGMPQASRKSNYDVKELYVPQQFTGKYVGHKVSLEEFMGAKLYDLGISIHLRNVVLGGPGIGKTTLFRYIHFAVAQGFIRNICGVCNLELSILIPFRNFVAMHANKPELSIIDYCYSFYEKTLELKLSKGFFEYYLITGRCLVLFDGMDEVGSLVQRKEMRDLIQGFIDEYPYNHFMISSRIVGYEKAAFTDDQFTHYRLLEFDENEITLFTNNWYKIVEIDHPELQDIKAEELQKAIFTNPKINELARNPLILTLITLIHRYEVVLPQERHVLYEKCVDLLLNTWNAAKAKDMPNLAFNKVPQSIQRKCLEGLAFEMMQMMNGIDDGMVSIGELEMAEIFRLQLIDSGEYFEDEPELTIVIKEWIEYSKSRSGILSETESGRFSFIHLTFLEYLCACAVIRDAFSCNELAEIVANKITELQWAETLLLIICKSAADTKLLHCIYGYFKRIDKKKDKDRYTHFVDLLCKALLEDIRFPLESVKEIFEIKVNKLLNRNGDENILSQLRDIYCRSNRNGRILLQLISGYLVDKNDSHKLMKLLFYYYLISRDVTRLNDLVKKNRELIQYLLPCVCFENKLANLVHGENFISEELDKFTPYTRKYIIFKISNSNHAKFHLGITTRNLKNLFNRLGIISNVKQSLTTSGVKKNFQKKNINVYTEKYDFLCYIPNSLNIYGLTIPVLDNKTSTFYHSKYSYFSNQDFYRAFYRDYDKEFNQNPDKSFYRFFQFFDKYFYQFFYRYFDKDFDRNFDQDFSGSFYRYFYRNFFLDFNRSYNLDFNQCLNQGADWDFGLNFFHDFKSQIDSIYCEYTADYLLPGECKEGSYKEFLRINFDYERTKPEFFYSTLFCILPTVFLQEIVCFSDCLRVHLIDRNNRLFREIWSYTSENIFNLMHWPIIEKRYIKANGKNLHSPMGANLLSLVVNMHQTTGVVPYSKNWKEMVANLDPDQKDQSWIFHLAANIYKVTCEDGGKVYHDRVWEIIREAQKDPEKQETMACIYPAD